MLTMQASNGLNINYVGNLISPNPGCAKLNLANFFCNTLALALAKLFPGENFPLYGMNMTEYVISATFLHIALQQPQAPEMSETTDAPDHTEELSVADQRMLGTRVVRQNFTLLYQHLAVAGILPALVQKGVISEAKRKEVEAYNQKYARNIVIMGALFKWKSPSDWLVRLTDVLAITPSQELVARKLRDGKNIISFSSLMLVVVLSEIRQCMLTKCTWEHTIRYMFCLIRYFYH